MTTWPRSGATDDLGVAQKAHVIAQVHRDPDPKGHGRGEHQPEVVRHLHVIRHCHGTAVGRHYSASEHCVVAGDGHAALEYQHAPHAHDPAPEEHGVREV
eukprot:3663331-Rhodomonas_salina.1